MSPSVIIGDIHGAASALESLLPSIERSGTALFLGDYVNRGGESKRVLELLVAFKQHRPDAVFLCGNHDWALREYVCKGELEPFILLGGGETIRSYLGTAPTENLHAAFLNAFPRSHLSFLSGLQPYFEDSETLFSHTGCTPNHPFDRSFNAMVIQAHTDLFLKQHLLKKRVACGHYLQREQIPFVSEKLLCLDTGCGTLSNGRLTAYFMREAVYIQADSSGRVFEPGR